MAGNLPVGLVLLAVAFALLVWNENRTLHHMATTGEVRAHMKTVTASAVDPSNEGHLVFVSGQAQATMKLQDPKFCIGGLSALQFKREAEIFQWMEVKTTPEVPAGTVATPTYDHVKNWSSSHHDTEKFTVKAIKEKNPPSDIVGQWKVQADRVNVGAFELASSIVKDYLNQWKALTAAQAVLPANGTCKDLTGKGYVHRLSEHSLFLGKNVTNVTTTIVTPAKNATNTTTGKPIVPAPKPNITTVWSLKRNNATTFDLNQPALGDVRVNFFYVPYSDVSILAKQQGKGFAPFVTSKGDEIFFVRAGVWTAESILDDEDSSDAMTKWLLRVVGAAVIFGGLTTAAVPFSAFLGAVLLSLLPVAYCWMSLDFQTSAIMAGVAVVGLAGLVATGGSSGEVEVKKAQ